MLNVIAWVHANCRFAAPSQITPHQSQPYYSRTGPTPVNQSLDQMPENLDQHINMMTQHKMNERQEGEGYRGSPEYKQDEETFRTTYDSMQVQSKLAADSDVAEDGALHKYIVGPIQVTGKVWYPKRLEALWGPLFSANDDFQKLFTESYPSSVEHVLRKYTDTEASGTQDDSTWTLKGQQREGDWVLLDIVGNLNIEVWG